MKIVLLAIVSLHSFPSNSIENNNKRSKSWSWQSGSTDRAPAQAQGPEFNSSMLPQPKKKTTSITKTLQIV
jgi:hypothetical protein